MSDWETHPDLKLVMVPKELYYHEVAYVRGLETLLSEAYEMLFKHNTDKLWDGNEEMHNLMERIETHLMKADPS